jgi:hypothetical protein
MRGAAASICGMRPIDPGSVGSVIALSALGLPTSHDGRHPRRRAPAALLGLAIALGAGGVAAAAAAPTVPAAAPGAPVAPVPPAASAPLPPGTPLYDVEIVVFRAISLAPSEDWSIAPTPRGFGSPGNPERVAPEVVRVLPPSDYRLMGVIDGMRRSGLWRPIAHAAWIQNAPSWGSHVGIPLAAVGVAAPGLSGTVYLERAPLYLHLGFDVSLQEGATYTIDEMHNIRQNEKEYFDHPVFGVIAVVTPLRQPAR